MDRHVVLTPNLIRISIFMPSFNLIILRHAEPRRYSTVPPNSILILDGSQCCGSGMFIPDPDFYSSRIQGTKRHRIPDPGSATLLEPVLRCTRWGAWIRIRGATQPKIISKQLVCLGDSWMLFRRTRGFTCSLDFLQEDLGFRILGFCRLQESPGSRIVFGFN